LGYNYATNANQADVGIIPDSIDSQSANVLILVPAGHEEDTVSFLLGPSAVRYVALPSSSFDALNASVTYTRLLGRRQTAPGSTTGGTATTDLFTLGVTIPWWSKPATCTWARTCNIRCASARTAAMHADNLCAKLQAAGGACLVQKN
jgi:hypothetical protein